MSYTLRPYQQSAVDAGGGALTDGLAKSHGLIVMPTGAGKSVAAWCCPPPEVSG